MDSAARVSHGAGDEPYPKQAYFRQLQRFMIDEVLVHHIDTARFLFGDIASIYAEGARRNPHIAGRGPRDPDAAARRIVRWAGLRVTAFMKHDGTRSTLDEATFEGDAGSIRINRRGRDLVRRRENLARFRRRIPRR